MFRSVHTKIIDEISMGSSKYFHNIHQRLCSIANNDLPFGGFNIILFDGFYQLGHVARKPDLGGLRTTKAQTSLRMRAVWSAPLLFAF